MVPDRQKVRTDGRKDGRNGRTDGQTDGRTDDAKTISLRLSWGIITLPLKQYPILYLIAMRNLLLSHKAKLHENL